MQYSQSDYFAGVNDLDLKNGDTTGMWMLNYPFPYTDTALANQFNILTIAAKKTALEMNYVSFDKDFKVYLKEREKFKGLLSDKDYRYFSFQIWQEGLAMYTELKFSELVKDRKPEEDLISIKDFTGYDNLYKDKLNNITDVAVKLKLEESKRVCFYYLGALEGMILDKENPGWRDGYFKNKFFIEKYYK